MPSSHLILCRPLLLQPPIPPSIRVFSNESTLRMKWPKYWSFSFSVIPSKEISVLISFWMDRLYLLAVQGTLKSLLQHHSSKASILRHQFIIIVIFYGILLSHWKECLWISSNEVDETGAYYTEWSKSERKTPIQYINAYIWDLEGWYRWHCMRDCKSGTGVKNRLLGSLGEGEGGIIWENSIETCILSYVK